MTAYTYSDLQAVVLSVAKLKRRAIRVLGAVVELEYEGELPTRANIELRCPRLTAINIAGSLAELEHEALVTNVFDRYRSKLGGIIGGISISQSLAQQEQIESQPARARAYQAPLKELQERVASHRRPRREWVYQARERSQGQPEEEWLPVAVLGYFYEQYKAYAGWEYSGATIGEALQDIKLMVADVGPVTSLACIRALFSDDMKWCIRKTTDFLANQKNRHKHVLPVVVHQRQQGKRVAEWSGGKEEETSIVNPRRGG